MCIRDRTSPGRIETDLLSALNKKLIQNYDFDTVKDRLEKVDKKIDEKFWTAIRGNLNTVEEIKQWTDIVYDSKIIEPKDKEFISTAINLMPEEPWDDDTWDQWTSAIKEKTNRKGKELFLPLREAFTGVSQGPEMKKLIQLIGRDKIIERVKL